MLTLEELLKIVPGLGAGQAERLLRRGAFGEENDGEENDGAPSPQQDDLEKKDRIVNDKEDMNNLVEVNFFFDKVDEKSGMF